MALKKSEKKLLIALGVVIVVSGIILYRVFNPPAPDPIDSTGEEEVTQETPAQSSSTTSSTPTRSSSSSPRRGSGGSSGSSSSGSLPEVQPTGVLLAEFEEHTSLESCWVVIDGSVYNISNYIENQRIQTDEINQYCGTFGFEVGFIDDDLMLAERIKESSQELGPIK